MSRATVGLLGALVAAELGCSAGRIHHEREVDGRIVQSEAFDFRSAILHAREDAWVVELRDSRRAGTRFFAGLLPNITGVRITFPREPEVGREYRLGENGEACEVEVIAGFSFRWRRIGPGTLRFVDWDPKRPYVEGTFTVRGADSYEGRFKAPY